MVPSVGVPRLADDEIATEEDDIPLLPMRCLFWGLGGGEFRAEMLVNSELLTKSIKNSHLWCIGKPGTSYSLCVYIYIYTNNVYVY